MRRHVLDTIGHFDLRRVGRRKCDERRRVERAAVAEEVVARHRADADRDVVGAGDARDRAHRIERVRITLGGPRQQRHRELGRPFK